MDIATEDLPGEITKVPCVVASIRQAPSCSNYRSTGLQPSNERSSLTFRASASSKKLCTTMSAADVSDAEMRVFEASWTLSSSK